MGTDRLKLILDWIAQRQVMWSLTVMVCCVCFCIPSCIQGCNENDKERHQYHLERDRIWHGQGGER